MSQAITKNRRLSPSRLFDLPPATHRIRHVRDVAIRMADGTRLIHNAILAESDTPLPTILIRTPYNRHLSSFEGSGKTLFGRMLAKRGYNFILQDARGTGDSEGEFEAYFHEEADGRTTIEWIIEQPWSDGSVGMMGQSYVGFTQWAAAASGTPHLKAIVPAITAARLGGPPDNAYPLDLVMRWLLVMETQKDDSISRLETLRRIVSASVQNKFLAEGFDTLPIAHAPEKIFGRNPHIFAKWLEHADESDPYWQAIDHRDKVASGPPAFFVSGWHDLFLDGLLSDYAKQSDAGKQPWLTVGPWTHFDIANQVSPLADSLDWFDYQLKGKAPSRTQPVRLFVMGLGEWRTFDAWPPVVTETARFLSGSGSAESGGLQRIPPHPNNSPSTFTYDPAEPTPNVGGKLLSSEAGATNNAPIEARDDVLVYTSASLLEPLEIIGSVTLRLYVHTTATSSDIFGRLCDVQPNGKSLNVCDDLLRINPGDGELQPDGSRLVMVPLSSTAYHFKAGHRLRLQVSGGAHPRFARNNGTDEHWLFAEGLVSAEITIYHDAAHPSALLLPIVSH